MKTKKQHIILIVFLTSCIFGFADEKIKINIKEKKQNEKKDNTFEDYIEATETVAISGANASEYSQNGNKKVELIRGEKIIVFLESNFQIQSEEVSIFSENIKFLEDNFKVISIEKLIKSISENQVIILDLNGYENYSKGHIPNALNGFSINTHNELGANKNNLIVVYFPRDDYLAWSKVIKIIQSGYNNVCYLNGGINDWTKNGGKLEVGTKEIKTNRKDSKVSNDERLVGKEIVSIKSEVKLLIKEDERVLENSSNKCNDYLELISADDLKKIAEGKSVHIINLIDDENFSNGHIPKSINGYSSDVISKLPKDKKSKIVFNFQLNDTQAWAKVQEIKLADIMKNGFRENYCYLEGGLPAWVKNGGKLEK